MNKKDKMIFWTINTDMTKKLNLKGLELLLFGIINNFTQDEEGEFYGRINWLAETLNVSRQAVSASINKLLEKEIIKKVKRKNQIYFQINKKVIDNEIENYNKKILDRECKESLHDNENDAKSDVKKLDTACKDSLHGDVNKLDIECKETLLSSYIYLNLYKTNIYKFILEKNIKEQFDDLLIEILYRLTSKKVETASKTTKLYSQIIESLQNRKYDLNDCIQKAYDTAFPSAGHYRWHNFTNEVLRLLNQGGSDIKKHKTDEERKIYEHRKIEHQKNIEAEKLVELEKLKESEKEAEDLGLNLTQYNILHTLVFGFSIENKISFDQDFSENIKIFIDEYPNYKKLIKNEERKH